MPWRPRHEANRGWFDLPVAEAPPHLRPRSAHLGPASVTAFESPAGVPRRSAPSPARANAPEHSFGPRPLERRHDVGQRRAGLRLPRPMKTRPAITAPVWSHSRDAAKLAASAGLASLVASNEDCGELPTPSGSLRGRRPAGAALERRNEEVHDRPVTGRARLAGEVGAEARRGHRGTAAAGRAPDRRLVLTMIKRLFGPQGLPSSTCCHHVANVRLRHMLIGCACSVTALRAAAGRAATDCS